MNETPSRRARATTLVAITLSVMALDQLSKYWLLYGVGMVDGPPIRVTEFFSLVMVWNRGVSFGMLNTAHDWIPYLLIMVAVGVSAMLARLAMASPKRWERVAYALVIGGALGNAIDRVRFGAVADFFYFHRGGMGWPAFNIADSAICVGVFLLLVFLLKAGRGS